MYCRNCGKEIKESEKFCPYCGLALQEGQKGENSNKEEKKHKLSSVLKKWWFWVGVAVIVIVSAMSGGGKNSKEVIEKLQKFTYVDRTDDSYQFVYDGLWTIKYTDVNEAVEFLEGEVYACLAGIFGDFDIGNSGSFVYDLDEEEIRMYLDYESSEGSISIINYDIEDNKFTVMKDGKHYQASDELEEYINAYGLADIMKDDIKEFKTVLSSNGLTKEEVTDLKYKDLKKHMK